MKPSRKKTPPEERIFVEHGRRHFRRSYSVTEVKIGAAVLLGLALILAWVIWMGRHPDPELFATGADQLADAPKRVPFEEVERRAPGGSGGPEGSGGEGNYGTGGAPSSGYGGTDTAPPSGERGALPKSLSAPGWTEGPVSRFDETNLYVKINGREDYYKSFGFRHLYFVSLVAADDDNRVVDIEMYDMGEAANALGAYSGERSADVTPVAAGGGMHHFDRNAFYLARGRFYVRCIGSEESPAVRVQLDHLKTVLERDLQGEALPWAYALFTGGLGVDPGQVSYTPENAFSFEFADSVYSALLKDQETELFVVRCGSSGAAQTLADAFNGGFLEYGSAVSGGTQAPWTKDRYLEAVAGATSSGVWLMGVRGAPDVPSAEKELARLKKAVATLSAGGSSP